MGKPTLRMNQIDATLKVIGSKKENALREVISSSKKLRLGSTVINCGCYVGLEAILFSKLVGLHGRVYSFEPNHHIFDSLILNLAMTKSYVNHIVIPYGLGHGFGHMILAFEKNNKETASLLMDKIGKNTSEEIDKQNLANINAIVVPMDYMIKFLKLRKVDFIWMNVEGFEEYILKGGLNTIKKFHPDILILTHKMEDDTSTKVNCEQMLKDLGYVIKPIAASPAYLYGVYKDE